MSLAMSLADGTVVFLEAEQPEARAPNGHYAPIFRERAATPAITPNYETCLPAMGRCGGFVGSDQDL
ncbi:hypothetical protein [Aurantiacibacter rhizosphaerae]|uniref:Uncharacterized protein n=1 Tax=Aurantiacibacter rhizosphaerae TaxID=2691582 RepID=A0A844XG04_9SPHN|nr:hypothetical protein [Aurantiacibacter rhizosphaerae]MWV28669.1 hypothetical protein [Aurantiacibacter rhizosphaerae]